LVIDSLKLVTKTNEGDKINPEIQEENISAQKKINTNLRHLSSSQDLYKMKSFLVCNRDGRLKRVNAHFTAKKTTFRCVCASYCI
jgi:hypothetical protein